ncbi:MAG TPA: hypothetical protein VNE39_00265 [Planctomycetota bacterium]|nr:hypothetical protein [Planctomycetota bacterium]
MIARLWTYFGFVGIASVVAWGAALLLLAAFARSRQRTRAYLVAFALALLGFILAKANSHSISEIEVDRSAEQAELRARARARAQKAKSPDTSEAPPSTLDPRPSTLVPPVPSYREAGKQKREEGAKLKASDLTAIGEEADVAIARRLPEADVIRADAYDRLNLFFARLTPWLALCLVCLDYLSRFNRTFGYLPPIPIAGRALDAFFPKTHAAHVQGAGPAVVKRYLEDLARKGESFLYLGQADPLGAGEVHRWSLGRLRRQPLQRIALSGASFPASQFVLDSAWFGRYCFVATGLDVAGRLLADTVEYLTARLVPHAAARRTVNVVWDFADPPPAETLRALAALCRETNFKLIVFSSHPPAEETAPLFDERLDIGKGA